MKGIQGARQEDKSPNARRGLDLKSVGIVEVIITFLISRLFLFRACLYRAAAVCPLAHAYSSIEYAFKERRWIQVSDMYQELQIGSPDHTEILSVWYDPLYVSKCSHSNMALSDSKRNKRIMELIYTHVYLHLPGSIEWLPCWSFYICICILTYIAMYISYQLPDNI